MVKFKRTLYQLMSSMEFIFFFVPFAIHYVFALIWAVAFLYFTIIGNFMLLIEKHLGFGFGSLESILCAGVLTLLLIILSLIFIRKFRKTDVGAFSDYEGFELPPKYKKIVSVFMVGFGILFSTLLIMIPYLFGWSVCDIYYSATV